MTIGRADKKPWISAPGWIDDEIVEGFVDGANGTTDTPRRTRSECTNDKMGYTSVIDIRTQECSGSWWRGWFFCKDHGTENGPDIGTTSWVVGTKSFLKN